MIPISTSLLHDHHVHRVQGPSLGGRSRSTRERMTPAVACSTVKVMFEFQAKLSVIEEKALRRGAAALATLAAIGAFATRNDDIISWIFLAPTVGLFWLWALANAPVRLLHLLGLSVPLILNLIESDAEVSMFIAVATTAVIAGLERNRTYAQVVLTLFVFLMVLFGVTGAISDFSWPNWLFGTIFAWGAGELLWRLRETVGELQQTRALVADQATINERRRIARDVHDLVGHSLTVVLLHVTGARHLVHKDPDEAERALLQAETAGRESLAEIRRTVGLLRDENDDALDILPASDLFEIPNLVDEFILAGVDVTADVRGELNLVDPAVGLAGYRIAQEALTNVSRHAVGGMATLTLTVDSEQCEIVVVNKGGSSSGISSGPGLGLTSMRERARSVGGSLLAGPDGDGWRVEASLPVNTTDSVR